MSIQWLDSYELGFEEIDAQHKDFVNSLNEFYGVIQGKAQDVDQKFLDEMLEKVASHAKHHFDTEEKYFDSCHFDLAEEHKQIHENLLSKVAEFQVKKADDLVAMTFEIIDFLEDWLVGHMVNEDRKYVTCFKECGLK